MGFWDAHPGTGSFKAYGPVHLAWLFSILVFWAILCPLYEKASPSGRAKIRYAIAMPIVYSEIIKDFIVAAGGWANWEYLPLHLCGLSIIIEGVYAAKQGKFLGECLYALSLPGALAALLFPNWTMSPPINFFTIHSFTVHGLLSGFVLMMLFAGEIRPMYRALYRPTVFLLVIVPPVYFINKALNTNFFFINEASEGSPLMPLQNLLGNPGYLFGYIALVATVWALMYLPFALKGLFNRNKS